MGHLTYLAVLACCLLGALWLEPALHVGVLRRWRRLALTVLAVVVAFGGWDVAAVAAGHWSYDGAQVLGVRLPGRLPLEELLFFVVVPVCTICGFEAVRRVTHLRAGDEPGEGGDVAVADERAEKLSGTGERVGSGRREGAP